MESLDKSKNTPNPLATVLLVLNITLVAIGINDPFAKGYFIDYGYDGITKLFAAIGLTVGANILTILAILIAYFAYRKNKRNSNLIIIIVGIIIIILHFTLCVFPYLNPIKSNDIQQTTNSTHTTVFFPKNGEYSATFPCDISQREGGTDTMKGIIAESKYPENNNASPYLRFEYYSLDNNRNACIANFKETLREYAKLSGLTNPEITISKEDNEFGKIGTFSGIKTIYKVECKLYGKVFIGSKSLLVIVILEPLSKFPSDKSTYFLSSIKRHN